MTHSLTCTFCRKSEHQVRKLVAGPGVYICDACIETAHAIIHDRRHQLPRCGAVRWRDSPIDYPRSRPGGNAST